MIAMDINALIKQEDCENWDLAASEKIGKEIINKLELTVKSKLTESIAVDLTKIPKSEVLSHFT
jgi:hypothetical protein